MLEHGIRISLCSLKEGKILLWQQPGVIPLQILFRSYPSRIWKTPWSGNQYCRWRKESRVFGQRPWFWNIVSSSVDMIFERQAAVTAVQSAVYYHEREAVTRLCWMTDVTPITPSKSHSCSNLFRFTLNQMEMEISFFSLGPFSPFLA